MKAKIKKSIKDIIPTMLKAHKHILTLLKAERNVEADNLMAQCQNCALYIGECIEKSEGEGTSAVFCLEMYCEQLYKMSRTDDRKLLAKLKRELDKSLYSVAEEIAKRLPTDKLKIVFLPYKAAMWDCMESIWESAVMDEECDVKVIPIPYYERREQGGTEKFCYEGNLFPADVRVTSYEGYSIENEHPDIIYIHNPYDDKNYVTSVHPDYYSSELKKYTDMLVYIPYYFNGNGPMDEMHRNLPAYRYIDKIVVQDEEKAESLKEYLPEEKIVVIGSPKADRILKLEREKQKIVKQDIPKEWQDKIAGKKVILFNVSITGTLQNSRYVIAKIQYIIAMFENHKKAILLWRPHPLLEATLRSMRPELYEQYIEIKNKFIFNGKGIYDETEDAGIAAVLADAYIGEETSSLVHYFGVLGKPVLFMNWRIVEQNQKGRGVLFFNTYFIEGKSIFFVPFNKGFSHDLYSLDLDTGEVTDYMSLPGSSENVWGCFLGIKKIDNKIILIPDQSEDIYIYHIDKKQATKIVLPTFQKGKTSFDEAVEYKGKLFLLPRYYPAIISLDLQNMEICEFKKCVEEFLPIDEHRPIFIWAYFKKDQYLYLASCNESKILIFNMENSSYKIEKIGNYLYGYSHMIYDGEYFWLAAYGKNYIIRWDEKSGNTKKYIYSIREEKLGDQIYCWLLNSRDEIIVCLGFSMEIIYIDKETGRCRHCTSARKFFDKIGIKSRDIIIGEGGFCFANYFDEEKAILFTGDGSVSIWNIYTDEWRNYPVILSSRDMLIKEKYKIEEQLIIKSTPYRLLEDSVSISQFIDYIDLGNLNIFKQKYSCYYGKQELTIGEEIHKCIKSQISVTYNKIL